MRANWQSMMEILNARARLVMTKIYYFCICSLFHIHIVSYPRFITHYMSLLNIFDLYIFASFSFMDYYCYWASSLISPVTWCKCSGTQEMHCQRQFRVQYTRVMVSWFTLVSVMVLLECLKPSPLGCVAGLHFPPMCLLQYLGMLLSVTACFCFHTWLRFAYYFPCLLIQQRGKCVPHGCSGASLGA